MLTHTQIMDLAISPPFFDQLLDVNQRISFESLPHLRHRVRAVDHPKGPHSRGFSPSPEGGGKRQVPGARLAEGVQPDLSQDTNPDSDGLASFLTLFGAGKRDQKGTTCLEGTPIWG